MHDIYLQAMQEQLEKSMGTFIPGAADATADLGLNQMASADLELSASDGERTEMSSLHGKHGEQPAMNRALSISPLLHSHSSLFSELGNGHHSALHIL